MKGYYYDKESFRKMCFDSNVDDLTVDKSLDFYICINAFTGPYVDSIFANDHFNVLNLNFDDVTEDTKMVCPVDNIEYYAKAPTEKDIEKIFNFLIRVHTASPGANVHIYCTRGHSRSRAIADFVNRTTSSIYEDSSRSYNFIRSTLENFLSETFYIKEIELGIDLNALHDYFRNVKENYQHLKWTADLKEETIDYDKHQLDGFYGWGIQSNLSDLKKPCPPFNVHKNGSDVYNDTDLVFGPIVELKTRFKKSRQYSISCQPPGAVIAKHYDTDVYWKIHVPLETNNDAWFIYDDKKFNMEVGKAYLVNTSLLHGTENKGNTTRSHLFFKVPPFRTDKYKDD